MDNTEEMIQKKGLTAPRVTPDHINSRIRECTYHRLTGTLTLCVLTLVNGFTVTGESACASPENFDEELGNKIARANATEKIWPLEGYLLKDALYRGCVENIAKCAHEINRDYCLALGDDSQPSWEDAPVWQKQSATTGVMFHIDNPDAGPEASHESWLAEKIQGGWVYGETKDPDAKTHPCIVAFEDLPVEQQAKDHIFRSVVHNAGALA